MLFKKHLANTAIGLKTMGKMAILPPFVLFIVLPAIFLLSYLSGSIQDTVIVVLTNILVPLLSVWWVLMFLREFIESDGNEILFVYGSKSQAVTVIMMLCLYLCCESILLIICGAFYPILFMEYVHITLVCIFYVGFAYFFAFVTKSIAITFIPILFYSALPFTFRALIGLNGDTTWSRILMYYLPQALLGCAFFYLGHILNKKFLKFH